MDRAGKGHSRQRKLKCKALEAEGWASLGIREEEGPAWPENSGERGERALKGEVGM